MSRLACSVLVFGLLAVLIVNTYTQIDEIREVTGLPIPIGAAVIYGQVTIQGIPRDERKPSIFVSLIISGTQVERRQTNEGGYFFFLKAPRPGSALLFEVDGAEVGRVFLTPTGSNQVRQDASLDWRSLRGVSKSASGVVSTKDRYDRSPEAEKALDKAMTAGKEKKNAEAITLLKEIVAKDPKDFFAWTVLGTVYSTEKNYPEASAAFAKALEQKPEFGLALLGFARLEIGQKNYDKAIEFLLKAVAAEPSSADANHLLGEAYLQNKKGSMAVGYLNKAIELAPVAKAEIHLRLAALYNAAGAKDRAAAEYKAFLEKVKDYPDRKKLEEYIKENTAK
ncbi:MAG: tetratricopeptide repeat protein [Blastocatellia bacterium]